MDTFVFIKILFLTSLAFIITIFWTPALTHFLYKHKMGKQIRSSKDAPIFAKLHEHKAGTPTMGGILIWGTTLALAVLFLLLSLVWDNEFIRGMNFLTRKETLLPLGALIVAAIIGLIDDYMGVKRIGPKGGGLAINYKLIIYTIIAAVGAWWFYYKLEWDILHVPFVGNFSIGWWYIPIFIFIVAATSHSVNLIDGLDGLAGGTLVAAFGAFGAIALLQGKVDLAAFCGVIVGATCAFLWFNINPARFIMGDTGAISLGVTLGIIAMLTNYALLLPIIGFLFVVESLSVIIQLTSKKIRKKKVFHSAPIHHHFQALGWSEPKIVMRFWLISGMTAIVGLILVMIDQKWF